MAGFFQSDILIAIGAGLGVLLAYEKLRRDRDEDPTIARLMMLGFWALVAWDAAESWRGFLYLLLMPIGAYKVAQVLAVPIVRPIAWRRRAAAAKRG